MKKRQKARVDTPVEELTEKETLEHYHSVMIEELHSKMDLVLEGIEAMKKELRSELLSFRNEVNSRFDQVEAAFKCNSHDPQNQR